jgi:hypothetical protein
MKRDYTDGIKENVTFFTGTEVEKTPAYGLKTLFVVGIQPAKKIIALAEEHKCKHIYLGANHSLKHIEYEQSIPLQNTANTLLQSDYYVTVDTRMSNAGVFENLLSNQKFTIVYALPIKNIMDMRGNIVLKLDDTDFKATNPGVWCWSVRDMINPDHFTDWKEYGEDETI